MKGFEGIIGISAVLGEFLGTEACLDHAVGFERLLVEPRLPFGGKPPRVADGREDVVNELLADEPVQQLQSPSCHFVLLQEHPREDHRVGDAAVAIRHFRFKPGPLVLYRVIKERVQHARQVVQ